MNAVFALFCLILVAIVLVGKLPVFELIDPQDPLRISHFPGVPHHVQREEVHSLRNRDCLQLPYRVPAEERSL